MCEQQGLSKRACMIYAYLMKSIDIATQLSLHHHENNKGLTALDMAAQNCVPYILLLILNTDNVFRFVKKKCGLYNHVFYDITSY